MPSMITGGGGVSLSSMSHPTTSTWTTTPSYINPSTTETTFTYTTYTMPQHANAFNIEPLQQATPEPQEVTYAKQRVGSGWYAVKYVDSRVDGYKRLDGMGVHEANAYLGKLKKGLIPWRE